MYNAEPKAHPLRIYYDMDGVLCDWHRGLREYFNLPQREPYPDDIDDVLAAADAENREQLFERLDLTFWPGLELIEKGVELYYWCADNFNTFILSASVDGYASLGKYLWLKATFDLPYMSMFNMTIFTRHKHFLANDRSLLIDDYAGECERFTQHGGWAMRFRPEKIEEIKSEILGIADAVSLKYPRRPDCVINPVSGL